MPGACRPCSRRCARPDTWRMTRCSARSTWASGTWSSCHRATPTERSPCSRRPARRSLASARSLPDLAAWRSCRDRRTRRGVTARSEPLRVGVLASGRGSNLQSLLDATAAPDFPARVVVVISDRERAQALERAAAAHVERVWLDPKAYEDRPAYDDALLACLEQHRVELVCLAGF